METLELFYPQIAARAGPYTFDKGVEIEVYSGTFSASFARYVKGVENSRTTSSSL